MEEIKVIRLYGFREYQKEKSYSTIDFKTKDRAIAKALQVSVHESAALRPTISDIGKTGGGGGAGAGHYIGILEIETPKRKVIIGVLQSGFQLGTWLGTGRQLFFSWGLAKVVDELLFKATGKHLRKEHFGELSGENFIARSRKYWEEARHPKTLSKADKQAIAAIKEMGGSVTVQNNVVVLVGFRGTKVTDAGMKPLKGLIGLYNLSRDSTKVTDAGLEHLKGLTHLTILNLTDTKVTDAGLTHLKGLTSLHHLTLIQTDVTDAGLEHLKGLKNLQSLYVNDTEVTDEGVKKLKQALPNCRIIR